MLKSKKVQKSQAASSGSVTIISEGTKIIGDLKSNGDIRVDGTIEGNIIASGKLLIGTAGMVKGNIDCNRSEISGTVTGKIIVKELLSLKETAKISGEIITNKLSIEPGAEFNGTCKMNGVNAGRAEQKEKK